MKVLFVVVEFDDFDELECECIELDAPDPVQECDRFLDEREKLWDDPPREIKSRAAQKIQSVPRGQIRRTPDSRSGMKGRTIRRREGRA